MAYINLKELRSIEKELSSYDSSRELIIKKSRELIKVSKIVINSIHRKDKKETEKQLPNLEKNKKEIDCLTKKIKGLENEGSARIAYQEYAEAKLFYDFINEKTISKKNLHISSENYLLGLSDLTGELSRFAVLSATKKDYNMVKRINQAISDIHNFFIKLNLRNSELRKKSDAIKWNLKKVEEIMYDISR